VEFLTEIFWALLMVGVPVGVFTLALVWWVLQRGHLKGSLDAAALKQEIIAMSQSRKKKKKKKKEEGNTEETRELHPLQKKWAKFGGGFYGIVALFTYIVVEITEIITMISDFGGLVDFIRQLNLSVIIDMAVEALMNFVTAITWPVYWMDRIDTGQVWIWFLMAYAGYWAGLKVAQVMVERR
jgi:hypothetical protein